MRLVQILAYKSKTHIEEYFIAVLLVQVTNFSFTRTPSSVVVLLFLKILGCNSEDSVPNRYHLELH